MSERGDEAPEEQRIKGTGAEVVSYQGGTKVSTERKEENS